MRNSQTKFIVFAGLVACLCIGVLVGFSTAQNHHWFADRLFSPFTPPDSKTPAALPLLAYSIPALKQQIFTASKLVISKELELADGYTKYLFTFKTTGKQMSGQLNIPDDLDLSSPPPIIVMLRGYVPPEKYETGVGTKNAAARFAQVGYITIAPDFFGFGQSDPEPDDPWQARFEKPAVVAELLATVESGVPINPEGKSIKPSSVGIWAHSNGGQIALTTLEILQKSYPTTLWAPVTAPFPYSILYFGDEVEDEGKAQRAWIALFERDYDVHLFSHTQFLADLRGPLQFQQGTIDDAVPFFWTEEFLDKLKAENVRRSNDASAPATIEFSYHKYPGADHNLAGAWETAVVTDLEFFERTLRR